MLYRQSLRVEFIERRVKGRGKRQRKEAGRERYRPVWLFKRAAEREQEQAGLLS